MNLWLVRHGEALSDLQDPNRPLSELGVANINQLGKFIAPFTQCEQIIHSQKLRAKQTADILQSHIRATSMVEESGLNPNDSVESLVDYIEVLSTPTMIVTHLPLIEQLAMALTRGNHCQFEPGNCLCLNGTRDIWHIEWLISPSMLISKE